MQQNSAAPQQTTTIAQKKAIVANISLFFALPVILLLRRKVGYRFMNPAMVLAMVVLLFIYSELTVYIVALNASLGQGGDPTSVEMGSIFIDAFAVLVLGAYWLQRFLRWRDIKRGFPWHTYSRGVSWLSFIPLSDSWMKRFVDPIACAVVGLIFYATIPYLAYYLLLAAACLFIFGAWDYEQQLNAMLDMLDSMVDSEVMSANVEYYSQPKPVQRPLEQTAGIPTGIAPDIQHQIERRRANRPAPLSNLVVSAAAALPPNGSLPGTTTLVAANGAPSTPQPTGSLPSATMPVATNGMPSTPQPTGSLPGTAAPGAGDGASSNPQPTDKDNLPGAII